MRVERGIWIEVGGRLLAAAEAAAALVAGRGVRPDSYGL